MTNKKQKTKRRKLIKFVAARILDYDWGALYAEQFAEWLIRKIEKSVKNDKQKNG